MKIAILGDFHLGYPRFYEDSFSQAALAFSKACETGDVVVLVGDLFDTKTPKLEVIERAFRIFRVADKKKWAAKGESGGVPVVAIHGTHERRHKDCVNPIQMLETAGLWRDIHNSKASFTLGDEKVVLQGLGGVPEEYAAVAVKAGGFSPEKGAFNVFVFHQSLREFIPGGGEVLSIDDLPPGFDLYACGHIHRNFSRSVGSGKLIIPGSTLITQMRKEETGKKGFVLFDTKTRTHQFVEIDSRPFFYKEIEVKEASPSDIRKKVFEAVGELSNGTEKKPIIKIKVNGTLGKGFKAANIGTLEQEFSEKAFLSVDISLGEQAVSKSLELLRDIREKKLSVKGLGLGVLKKKLAEANCSVDNAESLFDRLAEGKSEDIAREIAEK